MQHKVIRQTMLWLVAGLLLAMGCSQPPSEQELPTGDVQFVGSVPQALTGDNVTRLAVTLTASDVAANTLWLTQTSGVWSGTMYRIPAGPNRTFTAEAFDATGVLRFRGQATGVTIYDPATVPNGKVLVIGGTTSAGGGPIPELYDPATNSWLPVASMAASSRSNHFAFLQPNGKVLVLGGGGSPAVELYDPALYSQTPVGSLLQSRSYHQVTRLNSGKLLVTGGSSATSILSELYDPSTALSSYTASMPEGRYHHTATLLLDGRVLVAGGYSGGALTSSALYTP